MFLNNVKGDKSRIFSGTTMVPMSTRNATLNANTLTSSEALLATARNRNLQLDGGYNTQRGIPTISKTNINSTRKIRKF